MIERDGIISNVFESFFSYNYHIANVVKALQKDPETETQAEEEQAGEQVDQWAFDEEQYIFSTTSITGIIKKLSLWLWMRMCERVYREATFENWIHFF